MTDYDYTGKIFNEKYQIVRPLGRGGMGTVYLGKHIQIGRSVAIKILHNAHLSSEKSIVRFYREAQAAAAFHHKNSIDIFDLGVTSNGDPYLVMEYLQGESLATLLSRCGALTIDQAVGIIVPVLNVLVVAHSEGVVHRDLKPENIFISYADDAEPEVKLIDFGVSKITEELKDSGLTRTGEAIGTPQYMSPEQTICSGTIDHRSDLFAVGIILYEMLTGTRPFKGHNYPALLFAIMHSEPPPPAQVNPQLPENIEPIIKKALTKDVEQRFQSAKEMLENLRVLDCWESRHESLASLDSGGLVIAAATGSIGTPLENTADTKFAEKHLKKFVDEAASLAHNYTSHQPSASAENAVAASTKNRKTAIVMAALLLITASVLAVILIYPRSAADKSISPASPIEEKLPKLAPSTHDMVKILISGKNITQKTRIYWNNKLAISNPFETAKSKEKILLRVESPGFEYYQTSISPTNDQTISLVLSPNLPSIEPELSPPKTTNEKKPPISAKVEKQKNQRRKKKSSEKKIKKDASSLKSGKKGIQFLENFK